MDSFPETPNAFLGNSLNKEAHHGRADASHLSVGGHEVTPMKTLGTVPPSDRRTASPFGRDSIQPASPLSHQMHVLVPFLS